MSALLDRIRGIYQSDWQPVSAPALGATMVFALVVLYFLHGESHWVFPLDNANLAFHEFGHPLFGAFSERLKVYGGTIGQLVFPMVTVMAFWMRREAASCAVCGIWFFENFFNIARYMADARAHELPLVGGLDPELAHDWTEILQRWGLLTHEIGLARFTAFLGWIGIAGILLWLTWRWYNQE